MGITHPVVTFYIEELQPFDPDADMNSMTSMPGGIRGMGGRGGGSMAAMANAMGLSPGAMGGRGGLGAMMGGDGGGLGAMLGGGGGGNMAAMANAMGLSPGAMGGRGGRRGPASGRRSGRARGMDMEGLEDMMGVGGLAGQFGLNGEPANAEVIDSIEDEEDRYREIMRTDFTVQFAWIPILTDDREATRPPVSESAGDTEDTASDSFGF